MSKFSRYLLGGVFFLALGGSNWTVAQTLVIEGGTLIDGNGGQPVSDALIIIEGDRFQTITTKGKAEIPAGAKVIPGDGKFILPGFIDSHVHLADWHFELFLAHGVTTLVDLANVSDWTIAQREGIASGKIRGPRLFVSNPAIVAPGEGPEGRKLLYGTQIRADRDPEVNLRTVRAFIEQGVDVIKFQWDTPLEVVRVMAREARRHNLPTMCHCDLNILQSVPAGITKAEHLTGIAEAIINDPARWPAITKTRIAGGHPYVWDWSYVDPAKYSKRIDEIIRFLIQNDVHIEPTLESSWKGVWPETKEFIAYDMQFLHRNPALLQYIPAESVFMFTNYSIEEGGGDAEIERARAALKNFRYFLNRFVELGGKLDVDSDESKDSIAGVSYMNELILVQSMGFTPRQVIGMATKNPADWLGKLKDLGTVEEGKLADLIIVTKDPLENIRNIRGNVETVIIGGKQMDIGFHADYRNPIPSGFLEEQYYHAVPELDPRLQPRIAVERSETETVTVQGEGFLRNSQAYFKGVPVATKFVNGNTLVISLPGGLLREVGSWPITVYNPPPGGGYSNPVYFMVKFRL